MYIAASVEIMLVTCEASQEAEVLSTSPSCTHVQAAQIIAQQISRSKSKGISP